MHTITVNRPGLTYAQIRVTAASDVAFVPDYRVGSYHYHAIRVDATHYSLVRTVHAESNPAVVDAFNAVLSEIENTVKELRENAQPQEAVA